MVGILGSLLLELKGVGLVEVGTVDEEGYANDLHRSIMKNYGQSRKQP